VPPRGLHQFPNAILDRLEAGLTVRIAPTTTDQRLVLIEEWNSDKKLSRASEQWLATHVAKNVRKLRAAVLRARELADPALSDVEDAVCDLTGDQERSISLLLIVQRVVEEFRVPIEHVMSRRRTASIAWPRQIAMALARRHTNASLMEIGAYFGRDHGTVIHAVKRVRARCDSDSLDRKTVRKLENSLNLGVSGA